jgi:hypothetical protein
MTVRTRVLTVFVLAGVVAVSSALAGGRGTWFFHTTRS